MSRQGKSTRRALLGALGGSALLPFVPLLQASAASAAPKRLILFFTPHGAVDSAWRPTQLGTGYSLADRAILSPLEPFKQKLAVLSNLKMWVKTPHIGHTECMGPLWTGSVCGADGLAQWGNGPSVDQFLIDQLKPPTTLRSIETGFGCGGNSPASRPIIHGPASPLQPQEDPKALFKTLFAQVSDTTAKERQSSIDLVKSELDELRPQMAPPDQLKLDAHLASVRSLEQRLAARSALCQGPMLGSVSGSGFGRGPDVAEQHFQLITAALACDLTRFASFQWSFSDNDGNSYPWLGINEGHHELTHQDPRQFPDTTDKQIKIKNFYAKMFASLLAKLDAVPEGSGTLLDNSIVVWGSELGDAYAHNPEPTPFIVAGGAGVLKVGQHLDCQGAYHNRLLVTLCHALGATEVTKFGQSDSGTGALPGLI